MEVKKNWRRMFYAILGAFLVWFFSGAADVLMDIMALFTYNWKDGVPTYDGLIRTPHRDFHNPSFALLLASIIFVCTIPFVARCLNLGKKRRSISSH